jgi:preprotein translocase subunit SecD
VRRSTRITFVLVILLGLVAGWFALPTSFLDIGGVKSENPIRLGLDLQGGLQVLLRAEPPSGQDVDEETLNATRDTIERRVNELGVSEPLIQTRGSDQIVVELPGLTDPEQAIQVLQQTALLEIVDPMGQYLPPGTTVTTSLGGPEDLGVEPGAAATPVGATPVAGSPEAATPVAAGTGATPTGGTPGIGTPFAATPDAVAAQVTPEPSATPTGPTYPTIVEGRNITDAYVTTGQLGGVVVAFELDDEGANRLYDYTVNHLGSYMSIVVDKTVISSPIIDGAISSSGQISGLTAAEAQGLAVQLKAGSLQVPLTVASSNTIGPTLGQDSIDRSLIAGAVGLITVALFMILYYRLPGVLSVVALIIYTAVSMSLFKLLDVTMTLAGIAGFILSIGMAVDANVLIFARLKEELRSGHTLSRAVEAAFHNAFPSIRDSNVSTLITCAILWFFGDRTGTSLITAFAITLAIGVFVSLFTAIWVTRNFMQVTISTGRVTDPWLLGVGRDEVEVIHGQGMPATNPAAGD